MAVNAELIHNVDVAGVATLTVLAAVTVMVPVAFTVPQPPVKGMVYGKLPATVGVPLIVITFPAHDAVTPAGKPVAAPMPVAPVVACVMPVIKILIHTGAVEEADPAVFDAVTVTLIGTPELTQPVP